MQHSGKYKITMVLPLVLLATASCSSVFASDKKDSMAARLFMSLPQQYNTPDGMGVSADGSIILSVPNFNNDYLIEREMIEEPSRPFMAHLSTDNLLTPWYYFTSKDLHPETGRIGPMDNASGPDGHLYVADMQVFYDKGHKSRLLRIRVKDGKPEGAAEVLVEGFIAANGLYWENNRLYVTDSVIAEPREGELISGVYSFTLDELYTDTPIRLAPYVDGNGDKHLLTTFKSDNRVGFGADGVTGDNVGNIYVSVIETGQVYKLVLDRDYRVIEKRIFAEDANMVSSDGIIYSPEQNLFYTADFLGNAVHAIKPDGSVVTLQKNGDATGENGMLDQPAEVILRGNELIVVNMDMAWATPGKAVNKAVDLDHNLAVINLPEAK